MGSALSMVVIAVPVNVGRKDTLVWFQPRELETLPGAVGSVRCNVVVQEPMEVGESSVQGLLETEVALGHVAWLLLLLMGTPGTEAAGQLV